MKDPVSIFLIGIGGYGITYVNELLDNYDEDSFYIAGIYDPVPENCKRISEIKDKGIRLYDSIEEFYKSSRADLAVISSPIQYHCPQTICALSSGSNVLCEKPLAATVDDAYAMANESVKQGRFTAVGYQWSFSEAIIELKKDIISGKLGKPVKLSALVLWPRDLKYYSRAWAGKIKDPSGNLVLDSIANNAAAHYLHNMFFMLGDRIDKSAYPVEVTAELYRANAIENFDTSAVRAKTKEGVMIRFFASHAVEKSRGPVFRYEFENAVVTYDHEDTGSIGVTAVFTDGTVKKYGDPMVNDISKLWKCIDSIKHKGFITSPASSAIPHTICINGMRESMPEIVDFQKQLIKSDDAGSRNYVEGLYEILESCYQKSILPFEAGISWAKEGDRIDLKKYIKQEY